MKKPTARTVVHESMNPFQLTGTIHNCGPSIAAEEEAECHDESLLNVSGEGVGWGCSTAVTEVTECSEPVGNEGSA
jgi:hypothetical protein